jgi:hypothetical protein
VFLEKYSYRLGLLLGDLIIFTLLPTLGFAASKSVLKFNDFAWNHSSASRGADYRTKNLFDC